ncbi:MAG: hypothetical protein AAF629_30720 [Chloroflexota bacterium]
METAAKILILGGVLNIAYALLTGIPAAFIRQNSPTYPKYLRFVHVGSLMWGPLLISLVLALELSPLEQQVELIAAWLMVISSLALNAKDTINWLQGVGDEFVEKPILPTMLGAISALTSIVGIGIILVGVIRGL